MKNDKNTTIKELRALFLKFSKAREWEKAYAPNQLAKSVTIEAAELLEKFQWKNNAQSHRFIKSSTNKKDVSYEIVDILYYLLILVEIMDIDILYYIKLKLKELESRYPVKKNNAKYKP